MVDQSHVWLHFMQAKVHNLVVCFFFLFLINVSFYHLNMITLASYFRLIVCNFSANICFKQFFFLFSFEEKASKTIIVFNWFELQESRSINVFFCVQNTDRPMNFISRRNEYMSTALHIYVLFLVVVVGGGDLPRRITCSE